MSTPPGPAPLAPPITLRAVYFGFTETKLDDAFDPLLPGQMLAGWNTASPMGAKLTDLQMVDTDQQLRVIDFKTHFEFIYRVSPGIINLPATAQRDAPPPQFAEMKLAATIKADLTVSFLLNEDLGLPDPPLVEAWGKSTVLSVGWPYWREFCQTALFKMQLPPTLLPLLFINQVTQPTAPRAQASVDPEESPLELPKPKEAGAIRRHRVKPSSVRKK